MNEALKRAKKKYQSKVKRLTVNFYPTEYDLWDHLNDQHNKQGYIKQLIKQEKEKDGK